jgi:hypothetical protein
MRKFRLNGWQRIGIVLSIIWVPLGFVWAIKYFAPPDHFLEWPFVKSCYEQEAKRPSPNYGHCDQDAQKWYESQFKFRELQIANAERLALWFALAPIPIVWLLVYSVVWIGRWVRRGFQPAR